MFNKINNSPRTLRLCQTCMPSYKMLENVEENKALKELPGYTVLTCMLAVLRVLLNVTHENRKFLFENVFSVKKMVS